jgi:RNA polymerase sigma-70 factor, ECF subfamily
VTATVIRRPVPLAFPSGDVGREVMGGTGRTLRGVPNVTSPDALLAAVATGDRGAFAALYDQTSPRVHGTVLRVLRDPAQSEEVTQEVFLEVWRRAATFDPDRGSALAWMVTIAHRRAVDRVRSEQASRDRDAAVGSAATPTASDPVAETVEDRLERRRVHKALGVLSDLQRQSIELAYYDGLTYREVAERLGVPLGTVKTRMRDGLQRLRAEFDEAPS